MYSDISIRTIACSLSKINSARALASSVFPTPVGPIKIKDPIGRFWSWRPDRARRTAFDTASTASSCPITLRLRRSSICTSFSLSPSSILLTGIPVHLNITLAISSSSTSSFSILPDSWRSDSFTFASSKPFLRSAAFPYLISATLARSPSLSACCSSTPSCSIFSLISLIVLIASFSLRQWPFILSSSPCMISSSFSSFPSLSFDAGSDSFFKASRSISVWVILCWTSSISTGILSISILSFEAHSSIRSIALSGRKRSAI